MACLRKWKWWFHTSIYNWKLCLLLLAIVFHTSVSHLHWEWSFILGNHLSHVITTLATCLWCLELFLKHVSVCDLQMCVTLFFLGDLLWVMAGVCHYQRGSWLSADLCRGWVTKTQVCCFLHQSCYQMDGYLVQERRNSSALAMELRLSCTTPSKWAECILLNILNYIHVWCWLYQRGSCQSDDLSRGGGT